MKKIVLGGGCFWCIEAVYQRVKGVESVVSGYADGKMKDPTYHNRENHAEVVEITYDENKIPLKKLLEIFFYVHDPTTLNRQGNDVGTAYRSIILCSEKELELVTKVKNEAQKLWDEQIVTEIKTLDVFYSAEDYHQNYNNNNSNEGYCQVIINPKIAKFEKKFADLLKN